MRVISPSDCRVISMSIQSELKRNVSETTIKRLFGFAEIKHEFSKFTINTLKEYVNWIDEPFLSSSSLSTVQSDDIEHIKQKAKKISTVTIQNIRNRCSVPYDLTVAREFARFDFDYFRESSYSFTAFISQPGYGKSILLSHLIHQSYCADDAPFKRDIVLFLGADQLFNRDLDDFSLEDRLKLKLGLSPSLSLLDYIDEHWKKEHTKLLIFIDGFSDIAIDKTLKPIILDCITNFISAIGDRESTKLVLSMRSTAWSRFYENFRHSYFLKSKWFPGSYFNLQDNSNVPPLTDGEIEKIFLKMSPSGTDKISDNLKAQLKFPFHIQWYYQLREEYPAFESYTNIIYYEIIARFIQEEIYNSTYATEKALFCKRIIQLTNYGRIGYRILKSDLLKELSVFKNAYAELLADGILMEEKQVIDENNLEFVRFIQPHIFEYFLFVELYELFNNQMDKKFLTLIDVEYSGNQVRFQLLQWSARLMIKLHRFRELDILLSLSLNSYEKNYLIYFIAENLNYQYKNTPQVIEDIREQHLHKLLISKLIHFDFIDSHYKDTIHCLIDVADSENSLLFYHTILAIFDCASLNQELILDRLNKMEKLHHARANWGVDPYKIVELIYLKIKGIHLPTDATLLEIENFKNTDQLVVNEEEMLPNTNQVITYLLMLMVNLFYGSPAEAPRIISAIVKKHPKLKRTRKFFSIYLLNLLAQANARMNPGDKANQMEQILISIFNSDNGNTLTLYAQTILLSVKAEQSNNRKDYDTALKYAEECLAIYLRNDLFINVLYIYTLIIKIYKNIGNLEKAAAYTIEKDELMNAKNVNLPQFK